MAFESEALKQLKIYFLFIHADGESSPSEMKYLKDILEKEKLSDSTIQEFQTFCGQIALKVSTMNFQNVITEIDELLGEKQTEMYSWSGENIDGDKTLQAQTIWTLINLGYADSEYSKAEKEIVNHLIERWEMDPILVSELNDTADTILALSLQKKWVQKTSNPPAEIDKIIQELDRNIAAMFSNVELSISEANIA